MSLSTRSIKMVMKGATPSLNEKNKIQEAPGQFYSLNMIWVKKAKKGSPGIT